MVVLRLATCPLKIIITGFPANLTAIGSIHGDKCSRDCTHEQYDQLILFQWRIFKEGPYFYLTCYESDLFLSETGF